MDKSFSEKMALRFLPVLSLAVFFRSGACVLDEKLQINCHLCCYRNHLANPLLSGALIGLHGVVFWPEVGGAGVYQGS